MNFDNPQGFAVDKNGCVYLADKDNCSVRKIEPNGNIVTIGEEGSFNIPCDVAVDSDTNLYVSITEDHCIKKITPEGEISTYVSDGLAYPKGIDIDDDGNLYVLDFGNKVVKKISSDGVVVEYSEGNSEPSSDGENNQSESVTKKIGFIGLGNMGKPMIQKLQSAGYQVDVYARTVSKADGLDVTLHDTPKLLADNVDVVMSIISFEASDVREISLSDNGIIHTDNKNVIFIDMSTITPENSKNIADELRQQEIQMLDAPVSGGPEGAVSGTLYIMVGGEDNVLNEVRDVLEVLGKVTHFGSNGAGEVAKIANMADIELYIGK